MPPKKNKKPAKPSGKVPPPDETSFKEAVLTYRIGLKIEQMELLRKEIEQLSAKNSEQAEKNGLLMIKKERILEDIVSKCRQEEDKLGASCQSLEFDDVEKALVEAFSISEAKEEELQDVKSKIALAEEEITAVWKEVESRLFYKDYGQHTDAESIDLLENELIAMNQSYGMLSEHLQEDIQLLHEGIQSHLANNIEEQRNLAGQKALQSMDSQTQQEVMSNNMLKEEIELHRSHCKKELAKAEELEQQNLEILCELFDCQIADIEVTRRFYSDCSAAAETVDHFTTKVRPQMEGAADELSELNLTASDLKMLCVVGKRMPVYHEDFADDSESHVHSTGMRSFVL